MMRVTRPLLPIVATKAKARGTPAKLEATPEKLNKKERAIGEPTQDHCVREEKSKECATQGGDGADFQTHCVGVADVALVEDVCEVLEGESAAEALETPDKNGHRRQEENRIANKKKGATPSQVHENHGGGDAPEARPIREFSGVDCGATRLSRSTFATPIRRTQPCASSQ